MLAQGQGLLEINPLQDSLFEIPLTMSASSM